MTVLKPFKYLYGKLRDLVYMIRHGDEDLDHLYPGRHRATGEEAATSGSVGMGAMSPPIGF